MNELQNKVKERPILMNTNMVRAILIGQKMQTRRPMKRNDSGGVRLAGRNWHLDDPNCVKACPFGQIGDRLWVRERWGVAQSRFEPRSCTIKYFADGDTATIQGQTGIKYTNADLSFAWRPSIHMPRWASRITLEITAVRVEGIADISEEDAVNEGIQKGMCSEWWCGAPHKAHGFPRSHNTAKEAFLDIWDFTYPDSRSDWDPNPSVWVIESRRVE